jgi:Ca-activated chloride channel family protein
VAWTGPNADHDYVSIVPAGATDWSGEPYFYTETANPGTLVAPTTTGAFELWYLRGTDDAILGRRPITVTEFVGSVSGPPEVEAGSRFEVDWSGPEAPGDYVTILAVGVAEWDGESYFLTGNQINPGPLVAPIEEGDYELVYAAGSDDKAMVREPIHVRPYVIKLDAPAAVKPGRTFLVKWQGPDGPSDYITIVPEGAEPGTYLSYAFTSGGSPVTLTAPTKVGNYEIRYQSDRVPDLVFGFIKIKVKK